MGGARTITAGPKQATVQVSGTGLWSLPYTRSSWRKTGSPVVRISRLPVSKSTTDAHPVVTVFKCQEVVPQ